MDKFVRFIVVAALSFLPFTQEGCKRPLEDSVHKISSTKAVPINREAVNESARDIPASYDVDVVVVGGTSGGVAAAMAAKAGKSVRDIDIRALQKHLVEKGNLPENVLTDKDSFPLSKEKIKEAVERVANEYEGLEVVLAQPEDAMPLLREAYKAATDEKQKLAYAHILGMLGGATGVDTLLEAVRSSEWDKGWNFTGMGQYGASVSPLDSIIIALGRTGDKRAVKIIIEKVGQLDQNSEFSHCRAVAMALEKIGGATAARSVATLLKKPGMMGHSFTDIEQARRGTPASDSDTMERNCSLRELVLAAALYRCGDYEGLGGKILREYQRDLRAHYARYAAAVLKEAPGRGGKRRY